MKKATFGAGCFWHPEHEFRKVEGVKDAAVGYMGGDMENPTYENVCSGDTGHVEVCQITFDEEKISYEKLLEKFWELHDPTQENRQGPDIGTQYRSVIFYHDEEQKRMAEESMKKQQEKLSEKIMTKIEKAVEFYRAEEYHQQYLEKKDKPLVDQLMDTLKNHKNKL